MNLLKFFLMGTSLFCGTKFDTNSQFVIIVVNITVINITIIYEIL